MVIYCNLWNTGTLEHWNFGTLEPGTPEPGTRNPEFGIWNLVRQMADGIRKKLSLHHFVKFLTLKL